MSVPPRSSRIQNLECGIWNELHYVNVTNSEFRIALACSHMLSFLSPLFLVASAAAAVPLVLHFLNREPDARVKFSAVKLLRHAPVEHTRKRRLRQLLLLALRVATLVLLALAFARPFFATGAAVASSGVTIVALDTSYSMSAPGRFERAKQLARAAIDRAPAGDLVGVVTFSDRAEIGVKPTSDRVLANTAISE